MARGSLERLAHWSHLVLEPFHVYAHPDLEVAATSNSKRTAILMGYLFDATAENKGNAEILAEVVRGSGTPEEFILRLKPYAGRYVFIYQDDRRCVVVQDALALREVYYCTTTDVIVCGSQPNLIAAFSVAEKQTTDDLAIERFYKNEFKNRKWVGDSKYYKNIRHLLPNHYLEVGTLAAQRYWPTEKIRPLALDQAVERSCEFLQGVIKAAAFRRPLMVAVTAGTDSRTMLAASRSIAKDVYYFINKERDLTDESPDIRVPKAMLSRLKLAFHVHDIPDGVDPAFKETFLNNTLFASERILPTVFSYYKNNSDKLNILGIGEIGRTRYGKQPRYLSGYRMAYSLGYKESGYALTVCEKLIPEMLAAAKLSGINVMTLLYWEQMMGNWGVVGNSESDIAIEEFDP